MRSWLDPRKLNSLGVTPGDVANAIRTQNVQVSSGQLGGLPTTKGVQLTATIIGKTRLQSIPEFENILLKVNPDGSQVRLGEVSEINFRSEEHTSELQSLMRISYAVFCLKKHKHTRIYE